MRRPPRPIQQRFWVSFACVVSRPTKILFFCLPAHPCKLGEFDCSLSSRPTDKGPFREPKKTAYCSDAACKHCRIFFTGPATLFHAGVYQGQPGTAFDPLQRATGSGFAGLFRGVRAGCCAVTARRGYFDPGGWREFWSGHRHFGGLNCFDHRSHTGHAGSALPDSGCDYRALRPKIGRGQQRHRERRRAVSVYPAAHSGVSVFRGQPADGADPHPHLDLLLGQPAGDAGRHSGVCECWYATGQSGLAARGAVARLDWFVCAARVAAAWHQMGIWFFQAPQGVCALEGSSATRF